MTPTRKRKRISPFLLFFSFLFAVANILSVFGQEKEALKKEAEATIFITSNTGESPSTAVLSSIARASRKRDSTYLLLLGNMTRRKGFPEDESAREEEKKFLRKDLLRPLRNFKGTVIFIPGPNEWNSGAPESIDVLESFLQDNIKSEFWPDDGCPVEGESLSELVELVSVDTQWYLENWDEHQSMNSECQYRTREDFFVEFKDDLKDSQNKITIVALHHPILSNTKTSFFERVTGGKTSAFESSEQRELRGRIETLGSLFNDVIFVSGAHNNLQLLYNNRNPQIISSAGTDVEPVRKGGDLVFSAADRGYAKLVVFKDGSSEIQFFRVTNNKSKLLFTDTIVRELPKLTELSIDFSKKPGTVETASIYSSDETDKSSLYRWLWGNRYREVYSQKIEAPVLILDSLPGNVRPISVGGGQQSRSLRLINDNKNEFTLRAMRKDPVQYIQADLVKSRFIGDFIDNTVAKRFISDFFTTAHPYAPFAVNELSSDLGIPHANPAIYYVPKQKGLGIYNDQYGDALFMLEEHVGEENRKFKTFGAPDNILSTADLLLELRQTKKSYVDQKKYLRARLFDMLIGDWDRHQDQWRWGLYQEKNRKRYEPIPRDRDHAFPRYDANLMPILKGAIPLLRKMQRYDEDLENVKWFNLSGYPLDQRFLTTATWQDWKEQVLSIQEELTDASIEQAFASLPNEVQENSEIKVIKKSLKDRRSNLLTIARRYYEYLMEFQVITGTEESDLIRISREPTNTVIQILNNKEEIFKNEYASSLTEEIWIYGLDGADTVTVTGKNKSEIELKILGGEENDVYNFQNTQKVKLYDYASSPNTIVNPDSKKRLVDSYDLNSYHYKKRKYTVNRILPVADYVSDAGFTLGIKDIYTTYGLSRNPFTTQYSLSGQYYFSSGGYEIKASAEFANVIKGWNFFMKGRYASPNHFSNFFGFGNETIYDPDAVEKDYHRIFTEEWNFSPSLKWTGKLGARFTAGPLLEMVRVGYHKNSFLGAHIAPENDIFSSQIYAGAEAEYNYLNKNNPSYPSLGSAFRMTAGYKENVDQYHNAFGYIEPVYSFDYPLVPSGVAVLASKIGGKAIFGDNFELYHAASLGGNENLRGYRNHRFNGKYSFFHSIDLRSALGIFRTNFVPLVYGVTAGFDYGRVWTAAGDSSLWHNNYGGSVWINGFYALTANMGWYYGGDGNRITVTINFKY